jgi:hypothetical protein
MHTIDVHKLLYTFGVLRPEQRQPLTAPEGNHGVASI